MTQIEKQVSYLRKRITELVSLCQKDSSPTVSDDVLNTAQDIISRLRRLLDNIMSEYYINRIKPHLSVQDAKASKPTFPICDKVKKVIYENKNYIVLKFRCPFGVDDTQTQSQCYECKLFVERNGEIEIIDKEDFEFYELHTKLRLKILNRKE